ncbi:cupin-like domain-containing protein [Trinickia dinghuensis]|nr:cupin-like domain-containing protein [Trinickia dinghuensis]
MYEALQERLLARLTEHYRPLSREVTIDLTVDDWLPASGLFTLGPTLTFTPRRTPSLGSASDARIALSADLLTAMLDDPSGFDARNARAQALGGIRISGSPAVAGYWLQLLKRPSVRTRRTLARAIVRAPAALARIAEVDAIQCSQDDPAHARMVLTRLGNALRHCEPIVLRGLIRWPEIGWTLEHWRRREGATRLRRDPASGAWQSVGAFLADVGGAQGSTAPYSDGCGIPAHWESRFVLPLPIPHAFGPGQLWAGRARDSAPVTRLHCDAASSFLAQLCGRKRIRVYAPAQQDALYALDAFNMYRPCRVEGDTPDLARFPRFAQARGADVTIGPGDLLVLPAGWFHAVWALDDVLSISRSAYDSAVVRACRMALRKR